MNERKFYLALILLLNLICFGCFGEDKKKKEIVIIAPKKEISRLETVKLEVEFNYENLENKIIKWNTSNSNIAEVDENGNVTGINEGEVIITAESNDNKKLEIKLNINTEIYKEQKIMVAIGYGQSIASNNAPTRYECKENVYNMDTVTGRIYHAKDPMVGADGLGGSVWSRLGDNLIKNKLCDKVLFITLGVNGSSIKSWKEGGDLNPKLINAVKYLNSKGIEVSYLLWHQGSTDSCGMTTEEYKVNFNSMLKTIRESGVNAPVFISIHTGDGSIENNTEEVRVNRLKIQNAQKELCNNIDIFQGPDTDTYIKSNMRLDDKLHFNDKGYDKFADLWMDSIKKYLRR